MNDMASRKDEQFDFGKEVGLMHEVILTGRRVGADREFWKLMAQDSVLLGKFVKIAKLVHESTSGPVLLQDCLDGLARAAIVASEEASATSFATGHFDESGLARDDVEETRTSLFDARGRRIPPKGLSASVCDANYAYHVVQPDNVDYAERLRLAQEAFGENAGLVWPSAEEFQQKAEGVLLGLQKDEQCSNILQGPYFPICIPQMEVADYGQVLDEVLLPATERAYRRAYPGRTFTNHRKGELAGEVEIWSGSRHEQLVQATKTEPVVGVYFPQALQGYSINADREQMATLPTNFALCGGLDTLYAWIMYASELLRDVNTPWFDMAALMWRGWSLYGYARDCHAEFNDYRYLDYASAVCAASLFARAV